MATYNQPKAATPAAVLKKVNALKHMSDTNVSVANNHSNEYPGVKTSGIKIRGTGAATKGVMARGPMA
jgi:hypothetical protein